MTCGEDTAATDGLRGVWLSVVPKGDGEGAELKGISPCVMPMSVWVKDKTKRRLEGLTPCCGLPIHRTGPITQGEADVFIPVSPEREPMKRPYSRLSTDPLTAVLYLPGYLIGTENIVTPHTVTAVLEGVKSDLTPHRISELKNRLKKFIKTAGKSRFLRSDDFPILSHAVAGVKILELVGEGEFVTENGEDIRNAVLIEYNRRVEAVGGGGDERILKGVLGGEQFTSKGATEFEKMLLDASGVPHGDRCVFTTDMRIWQPADNTILTFPLTTHAERCLLPPGYSYYPDFITEKEEKTLFDRVNPALGITHEGMTRRVAHFGYKFLYPAEGIDVANPDPGGLPTWISGVAKRVEDAVKAKPDTITQMTANEYAPGQGISPHFDDFSTIGEPLCTLSLLSPTLLTLTHPETTLSIQVALQPRSLGVMTDQARYQYTHCMPKRMTDPSVEAKKKPTPRGHRVSLTFRNVPPREDWRAAA